MRVVVIGATGNVGTSVVEALAGEPDVTSIVGVARRRPPDDVGSHDGRVTWRVADIMVDDLVPVLHRADAVVHLAWAIQPSHDERALWRTNVHGTVRVLEAAAAARVPAVVYASSVGAYSPGPKDR